MAAIKAETESPDYLPGHALVDNAELQGMLYTAESNGARVSEELEKYASLGVAVLIPIAMLQRWQRAISIPADADE